MEKVLNKWNGRVYKVLEQNDNTVTLERDDGSQLTIEAKEFRFNYKEQKSKSIDKVN
jgi:hypothetical protein